MAKDRKGTCLLVRPVPSRERASGEIAAVRGVPQEFSKCHFQNRPLRCGTYHERGCTMIMLRRWMFIIFVTF